MTFIVFKVYEYAFFLIILFLSDVSVYYIQEIQDYVAQEKQKL